MRIPLGSINLKVHEEGQIYIIIAGVFTLLSMLFSGFGGITVFLAFMTCFIISFFRDPERIVPDGKDLIVSPGDGVIVDISNSKIPEELGNSDADYVKVSIFLSVFNVHVNRIPIAGKITDAKYHPGKFLNASLDKASKDNERNTIAIEAESGEVIYCVQIAGLIARRIISDAYIGDLYATGERYGIIRFGSRMDLYIPAKCKISVALGQTMVGGETVIAKL